MSNPDPREQLRRAQADEAAAISAVKAAASLVARAKDFITSCEAELARFADVNERVAAERAEDVRIAIMRREKPSFALSNDLSQVIAGRLEAENRVEGARQAGARFGMELAEARTTERRSRDAVLEASRAIISDVIEAKARRLAEVEAEATRLRAELTAVSETWFMAPGDMAKPIELSQNAVEIFNALPPQEQIGVPGSMAWRETKAAGAIWRAFFEKLAAGDADANLEQVHSQPADIAEAA